MIEKKFKWRPRTTLAHLLLLTAAVAAALAYHRIHRELQATKASVMNMRSLSRQLIVDDPTKIAAITRVPTVPGEYILDVYVPDARSDSKSPTLRLALEGIVEHGVPAQRFPQAVDTIPISPGRHTVEIQHDEADSSDPESQHEVSILFDGEVVMRETRPPAWMPANGWSSTGTMTETVKFDPEEPAELHRRRFNVPTGGGSSQSLPFEQPATGILVWIE